MPGDLRRQRGFTLVEVLVALVILGLVLGGCYQLFSTGLKSIGQADRLLRATMVARSVMAAVGPRVSLQSNNLADVTEDGYRWSVQVKPYDDPALPDPRRVGLALYDVTVTVEWDAARSYSLETLAVGPPS